MKYNCTNHEEKGVFDNQFIYKYYNLSNDNNQLINQLMRDELIKAQVKIGRH